MQDLDLTQYGEADAGGRRRAERLLVRETLPLMAQQDHLRRDLYETLCKADASAPARAVDSSPEAAIRSNLRLPIASTALGSSSGTPWTILSQGNRYADDDH
jgi:hypothetical protein